MKIIFMGTPDIAVPALEALAGAGHEILCVYTQPPRPAGRGHKTRPSPVHSRAEALGLSVRHPKSLKNVDAQAEFAELGADIAVVIAYGLILPAPVLEAPEQGCVNIHVSLLPRWRGAAPIQRAIMAGDAETGVTIMKMDEELDTGPIFLQEACAIGPETTAGELHDRLADIGSRLIVEALAGIGDGTLMPEPQEDTGATYAEKLSRDEGLIDWSYPAAQIERNIRALNPWPGCWFEHGGERIRVLRAATGEGEGAAGTVLNSVPTIACGEGALRLETLQRAGRKPMAGDAFLRGYDLPVGAVLGAAP